MMIEWGDDDGPPGRASRAFVALACAAVWLICAPFQIYARLCERAESDPDCEGADWSQEGLNSIHDGAAE